MLLHQEVRSKPIYVVFPCLTDHTDEDVPSQDVLWWHIVLMSLVIAVIVILILTLIISLHNYYNKRGQYTFISENIPLTTKSASGKA